ncbi:hypothetical protein [Companilactobacillus musae]|uniref:hypothetical protein n=1 Tax=Companilactobacillus musae TaxID=1903258 RepID=UPI000E6486AD|nr:hypothetical protein [Companilactobacillus musae]
MSTTTQMIFNITIIFITVTLIVGVILISIALFRIIHALKYRNQMLKQVSRPYLTCHINHQQLEIHNISQIPIVIDETQNINLNQIIGQTLPGGQSFYYPIENKPQSAISIKYHDQIDTYTQQFKL